jgi:hypothetical protein
VPDWDDAAVAERLDVAAVRVLGDKTGRGRSARMRLHVSARYPLADAVIAAAAGRLAGRTDGLRTAVATHHAEQDAARIEAQLATQQAA